MRPQGMADLLHLPLSELERARRLDAPADLRTALFADLCRLNALYMIARAGSGHIGSSFSSLDIVTHLFLNELRIDAAADPRAPRDLYFSSKGHDAPGYYAVLIGLGLLDFDLLHRLRRIGGLPGHPDIATPWIEVNSGSLGMGISKAKGIALASRLRGGSVRIFVLTGDGELQEGQIWESLGSAANLGLSEITVIVDHNKLQSDTFVSRVGDLGNLEARFRAFGWDTGRCDGHQPAQIAAALARAKAVDHQPSVIVADTIKGKGVSFMEHTRLRPGELYSFHSGAPSPEQYEKAACELLDRSNRLLASLGQPPLHVRRAPRSPAPVPERPERLVQAYAGALVEQGGRVPELVVLDADLVLDCGLVPFREAFPDRFLECGIAEQDMVSLAGGLALEGLLPVVHSFAAFLSARANEQIYNAATERTRILYVGSLAGLLPGGPGHSHQAVRDVSALAAVPGLELLQPATEAEVGMALEYAVSGTLDSVYLRLSSVPCVLPFRLPERYRLERGRGAALRPGTDAVLLGHGPVLLAEAFEAARILADRHAIELEVVDLPWLNHVDPDWLRRLVGRRRHVFTLDDHYLRGGQGEMLAATIPSLGLAHPVRVTRFGVDRIPECGSNPEVLRAHGLDARSLAGRMARALEAA